MPWKGDPTIPAGHQMNFKDALFTVMTNIIPRLVLPDWAMSFTKKTREIALGYKEFKVSGERQVCSKGIFEPIVG